MSRSPADRVARFVEDLLHGRRPRRFRASDEELEAMKAAAGLASARLGSDLPERDALDRIHQRLATALDEGAHAPRQMTRRTWLQTAGAMAAAVIVGVGLDEVVAGRRNAPSENTGQAVLQPDAGSWRPVASVDELPAGHAMAVSTGAVDAVIVNEQGSVSAVSGICTHLGCKLQPDESTQQLKCPCHQTAFSWSGRVLYYRLQSAPANLPRIPARVNNGKIELYVV